MTEYTHHAEYTLATGFFHETTEKALDERSPAEAAEKAPAYAYAFRLFDKPVADFEVPEGFKVVPQRTYVSSRIYLGGTIHTLAEVEAMGVDFKILASNMRGNHWSHVIHVGSTWQAFEEDDIVWDDGKITVLALP